ncbi:MAG: hypothetical protein OXG11_00965, partial [Chloroflexi bacterium]|nr:hypothetical protein [Chloroflexota bacterium]
MSKLKLLLVLPLIAIFALVACDANGGDEEAMAEAQGMMTEAQGMMTEAEGMMAEAEEMMAEAEGMMAEGDGMMMESRLATVQSRGTLICASRNDVPGYGSLDSAGRNVGFDIDLCRAVAPAVLGDPEAIEIRLTTAAQRGPTTPPAEAA